MRIPRVVLHIHVFNLEVLPEIATAALNLKLAVGKDNLDLLRNTFQKKIFIIKQKILIPNSKIY